MTDDINDEANKQAALFERINKQLRELVKHNQRQLSDLMCGRTQYLKQRIKEIGANGNDNS